MAATPMIPDPLGGQANTRRVDMTGQRYGRLTVLSYAGIRGKSAAWICQCDCGATKAVQRSNLISGSTVSCGCWAAAATSARSQKHGGKVAGSPVERTYRIYTGMVARCTRPSEPGFKRYGARGISVCDRWLGKNGFQRFLDDMGPCPAGLSIERCNNDGDYEPTNCRWATAAEQNRNTSRNRFVEVRGERLCVTDAALKFGLSKLTLVDRLNRGWSDEAAALTPVSPRRRRA